RAAELVGGGRVQQADGPRPGRSDGEPAGDEPAGDGHGDVRGSDDGSEEGDVAHRGDAPERPRRRRHGAAPAAADGSVPPRDQLGVPHPGLLYWDPQMSAFIGPPVPIVYEFWQVQGQPVGRVIEPLKPQGSRMQMRYIEDDFSLSYRQPSDFGLDVEQIYW